VRKYGLLQHRTHDKKDGSGPSASGRPVLRALPGPSGPTGLPSARNATAARRRRVLGALLTALAVPALAAVVTGSSAAWWAVMVLLPIVCTYVAVLFRARRLMAEREINMAFFGGQDRFDGGLEDLFSARRASLADERAVGAGRY
jgi:hypothetical protein